MFAYYNNGLSFNFAGTWNATQPGQVLFPEAPATPAQLLAAFPGYTSAAEVQALTAQIASLQTQIDALDGGTQARSVRAGLLAVLPAGNADLARLQALETSIVPLRAEIAPLQTQLAATQAALTAATTPAAS